MSGWLNELFRHAIAEGLISINPVSDVDVVFDEILSNKNGGE